MNSIDSNKKKFSSEQREELKMLKVRFEKNMNYHKSLEWVKVQARLDPESSQGRLSVYQ